MSGRVWVPVASGPLAPYAAGYGSWLAARGYSRWTVSDRLWQLELDIDDLDAPLIGAVLTHLGQERHNSAPTRNNRLAAIHSLYRYAALKHPEHATRSDG